MIEWIDLADARRHAKKVLDPETWEYVAGGAGSGAGLKRNLRAFADLTLMPRVLRNVATINTQLTGLWGGSWAAPMAVAPMAYHCLSHSEGEVATARAASSRGIPMTLSTFSTRSVEDVVAGAGTGPVFFQLYVFRDRGATADLIARVSRAGASALVITVDVPAPGKRPRERRSGFKIPPELTLPNVAGAPGIGLHEYLGSQLDPTLNWDDLEHLVASCNIPVLIKGILSPEDAVEAVKRGVSGIIVSNHGARQMDAAPAPLAVLPAVVNAVEGAIPVLVDGGIRSGTDLFKALVLGARGGLVGRPVLWGLAGGGGEGVSHVLDILKNELILTMRLCGVTSLAEIGRHCLWQG